MRGWLSYIAKASTVPQEIFAYEMLHQFLKTFRRTNVLDFDDAAAGEFVKLKSARLRVGTMDLKIASIALAIKLFLLHAICRLRKGPGTQCPGLDMNSKLISAPYLSFRRVVPNSSDIFTAMVAAIRKKS